MLNIKLGEYLLAWYSYCFKFHVNYIHTPPVKFILSVPFLLFICELLLLLLFNITLSIWHWNNPTVLIVYFHQIFNISLHFYLSLYANSISKRWFFCCSFSHTRFSPFIYQLNSSHSTLFVYLRFCKQFLMDFIAFLDQYRYIDIYVRYVCIITTAISNIY